MDSVVSSLSLSFCLYGWVLVGQEEADAADSDLKTLERMRVQSLQARAATEASIQTLQNYYLTLQHVESLFPVGPDAVRVLFTWQDAFR